MTSNVLRNYVLAAALTLGAAVAASAPAFAWGAGAPDSAYDSVVQGNNAANGKGFYDYAPGVAQGNVPNVSYGTTVPSPGPNRSYGVR